MQPGRGSREGTLDRPTTPKATCQSAEANSKLMGPIHKKHGSVAKGDRVTVATITSLFLRGCPAAIAWLVAFFIVNAVDGESWRWLFPHVVQECCKRGSPPVADGDSPSSVVGELFVGRVCASADHRSPCFVLWSGAFPTSTAVSGSVPSSMVASSLPLQTAAALSACTVSAVSHRPGRNNPLLSANAPATPILVTPRNPCWFWCLADDSEPSVLVADEIKASFDSHASIVLPVNKYDNIEIRET